MNHLENLERVPPLTANIGQACYACYKDEGEGITLQKCGKCRTVRYCGAGTQALTIPSIF